jgi:hypothetical protein
VAGAIIIVSAIGILLLVLVGYVLVGSSLASGDMIASAQKDMTGLKEGQLNTNITVTYTKQTWRGGSDLYHDFDFRIQNTGNTIIDYQELNMVIMTQSPSTVYINGSDAVGWIGSNTAGKWQFEGIYRDQSWSGELFNPNQWDPGEYVYGWIGMNPHPTDLYVFTPNGATGYSTVS